jgi:predicted permease
MTKLVFTLGVITLGLALGYTIQRLVHSKRLHLPLSLTDLRRVLQKVGLFGFMYTSFVATVWIIRVEDLRIAVLPALGMFTLLLGGALALALARAWGLSRKQTGSYFACGCFSNIGSIGALVVFVFLGEGGFAYVPLYKLFEEVVYFVIGFPVAKYFSVPAGQLNESAVKRLKAVLGDVFVVTALGAIALGAALNLSGVERPEFVRVLNGVLIPAGTFLLLTATGLAMQFSSVAGCVRECAAMMGLKFLILPATACLIGYLCGLGDVHDGLPLKVILILSSTPVAFTSLIPPSIYDLDLNLSNACWLTSTLSLVAVLPAVYLLVGRM